MRTMWSRAKACLRASLLVMVAGAAMVRPDVANAFESDEHARMSTLALRLAAEYIKQKDPDASARAADAITVLSAPIKVNGIDASYYGHLTACVDYFLTPDKMLAYQWGAKDGTMAPDQSMPTLARFRINDLVAKCVSSAEYVQASHANHSHFQQGMMMSWRMLHAQAVALRKDELNPYAALVVNAIADHYLQDFFAPGHIVTPRSIMTDVTATSMHDLANVMGASFNPSKASPSLRTILTFLCPNVVNQSDAVTCEASPEVLQVYTEARLFNVPVLASNLLADAPRPVTFRGDGKLLDVHQDAQRFMLLAVQVQSIVDALTGENHFKFFEFDMELKKMTPTAVVDFGRYDIGDESRQRWPADEFDGTGQAVSADGGAWSKFTVCSFGQCRDRPYMLRTLSPIFSLGAFSESQTNGSYSTRLGLSLEAAIWPPPYIGAAPFASSWFPSGVQVLPVVGYSVYRQGLHSGSGPTVRLAIAMPETEVSFSPYLRYLSYVDGESRQVRRTSYGLQIEMGFSSYITAFIGAGRDQSANADGDLVKGLMLSGGLRFSFPLTRVPFLH